MNDAERDRIVAGLPTPTCPRCGNKANEKVTRYGIRAECCGLWSWNRQALVDAKTHDARKDLAPLLRDLSVSMTKGRALREVMARMGIKNPGTMNISAMNEATAIKAKAAAEDLLMDIMAGKVKP
jgi:hypothetical protein